MAWQNGSWEFHMHAQAHKETVHGHGEWTIQDLVCWSQEVSK